jgi:hypothetical protein
LSQKGGKKMEEIRKLLIQTGFLRVDGLKIFPYGSIEGEIQERLPGDSIRWGSNNGVIAVALPNGEVWVLLGPIDEEVFRSIRDQAKEGLWVPLSNWESLDWRDAYRRMRDPDWIPDYIYNQGPVIRWRP